MLTPAPIFTHDCGPEFGCRYLGTMAAPADYRPAGVPEVDLWVHTYDTGTRQSLIYRWSDDEPEYESVPYGVEGVIYGPPLEEHPVFSEVLRRMAAQ